MDGATSGHSRAPRPRAAALAAALALAGCASTPSLDETKLVDLTHALRESTLAEPGGEPFLVEREARRRDDGRWFASARLAGPAGAGTHLEAPGRLAEGRGEADEIPLRRLVAPIRVVDVSAAADKDRSRLAGVEDLRDHERAHGRIPAGAAVLVRTGWSKYWDQPERYVGGERPRFPGVSAELAAELVARNVDLVGIDTADLGGSDHRDHAAKRVLAGADVPVLENLALPADFPSVGATLLALPLSIEHGASAPARVVAIVP
jgi:kynurenine formamidase